MKSNTESLIVALCVILISFSIPLLVTKFGNRVDLRREAIERGFAEYNPTNGVWQWKTNSVVISTNK